MSTEGGSAEQFASHDPGDQDSAPQSKLESPKTPAAVQHTAHAAVDRGVVSNTVNSLVATTTSTTTTTSHPSSAAATNVDADLLRIRLVQPSDGPSILTMWLEGWEDTLSQNAPLMWDRIARTARLAAIAIATASILAAAFFRRQIATSPAQLPPRLAGLLSHSPLDLLRPAALLGLQAVVALPAWLLAAVLLAAVLAIVPSVVPVGLRMALLRRIMYRMIQAKLPDMWDLHRYWARPAARREYWVAELQPGGRLVGGVAIKMGSGVRPLPPPSASGTPQGSSDSRPTGNGVGDGEGVEAGEGGAGGAAGGHSAAQQLLAGELPEDETGFTQPELKGHGTLEARDALVFRMVTDKALRRRGIGRRLMEVVAERAAAARAARLLLSTANSAAIAFYEKACGFETRPGVVGYGNASVLWREVAAKGSAPVATDAEGWSPETPTVLAQV